MIGRDGAPKVIEFNVRLGDPETQPIMLRLQSDLAEHVLAALDGNVAAQAVRWDPRPAIGVVIAAHGYPAKVRSGDPIEGLDAQNGADVKVFHAGTRADNGVIVSAGGRVLTVCAMGDDLAQARDRAYAAARRIHLDGAFYRRDIGHRALRAV
jgi:phosphoribosylamine--glycine ligase